MQATLHEHRPDPVGRFLECTSRVVMMPIDYFQMESSLILNCQIIIDAQKDQMLSINCLG